MFEGRRRGGVGLPLRLLASLWLAGVCLSPRTAHNTNIPLLPCMPLLAPSYRRLRLGQRII
jgi:hypothetical protein